jgi:hypothetical protein
MTISTFDPGGSWSAWWRPDSRFAWTRLASGNTHAEALANLQGALERVHGGDRAVLPAGRRPDRPASTFGRRRF